MTASVAGRDSPSTTAVEPTTTRVRSQVRDLRSVNIRKVVVRSTHLDDLVSLGTMTAQCAAFLDAAVSAGLNILVAGGTQAGKPALR